MCNLSYYPFNTMKDKIKEFIGVQNPSFSSLENMVLNNRSDHEDPIHHALFYSIDQFAKQVICDLHNTNADTLYASNQLNIVSDEAAIAELIAKGVKEKGIKPGVLNNPEMIYKAFNFVRPINLLPNYVSRLYLIKQRGISESGIEKDYVINPYFFGFKISLDIFLTNVFCSSYSQGLEEGLIKILSDKYGTDYTDLYQNVSYVALHAAKEGKIKGDQKDETFISWLQAISGINDRKLFFNFIYESGTISAQSKIKILAQQ